MAVHNHLVTDRISRAFEWRLRHYFMRVMGRRIDEESGKHFYNFERARQMRATLDSMDYADANMRDAAVYPERRDVLSHGLREVGIEGLYLEFGVWRGRTINFIAEHCDGMVHGFDSFEGLPEDWTADYQQGHFTTQGTLPSVRSNVQLHVGWFDQTLPDFVREHPEPIAFMHVDCDLYSSTKTAFDAVADRIVPNTVIVFDEYFNYPRWREHEYKAFQELVAARDLKYRYLAYNDRMSNANVAVVIE